jgi:hypothetical protein
MTRPLRDQLVLDLDRGKEPLLSGPAPEELLQALADLLLEALGGPNKGTAQPMEVHNAIQDHA